MKKIFIFIFTVLLFANCKKAPQQLKKIEGKQVAITEEISTDTTITAYVKPYKTAVDSEMSKVLSYTPIDLTRTDGKLESSLGNLLADLCYQRANPVFKSRTGNTIDFALFNYGGIRAGITKGDITTQNAFNLMPFENALVVVELTAEKIEEMVAYLIQQNLAHPLSKQFNLTLTNTAYTLIINNTPFDKSKTYFVLTSDYLQNGGDNMNFFKNPVNLTKLDYKLRNAIIDYFAETDTINVELDGRFIVKN